MKFRHLNLLHSVIIPNLTVGVAETPLTFTISCGLAPHTMRESTTERDVVWEVAKGFKE
jgi:hypothetical protein